MACSTNGAQQMRVFLMCKVTCTCIKMHKNAVACTVRSILAGQLNKGGRLAGHIART
jgi:hypothetical protein